MVAEYVKGKIAQAKKESAEMAASAEWQQRLVKAQKVWTGTTPWTWPMSEIPCTVKGCRREPANNGDGRCRRHAGSAR
ncbi:hypothetical protein ACFXPA_44175 [Amycolatopsis sp. NPDC059090]|uniref:hypothetical protein n=1 Tax=unclassified Amycolatopsis TaxID=2618356 RepID=UPI00366C09FE